MYICIILCQGQKILVPCECNVMPDTFKGLNTWTTDKNLQQSGKQDLFRHILKSSASTCEPSGSQFFRTTTGIQSRSDSFDKSMLIMTHY